jgi:hypothetical protein
MSAGVCAHAWYVERVCEDAWVCALPERVCIAFGVR